jgi:UDP-GlcNAc:undecaprenyl-phosphate GlcNAc-1-phosphate transferase
MSERDAVFAFLVAAVLAWVLTPLTARLAVRLGAVDEPRERGLSDHATPRLGGLAIFVATIVAGAIWLPMIPEMRGILIGAAVITLVGALDDVLDLHPAVKLAGQFGAAAVPVLSNVSVDHVTIPFLGALNLGEVGGDVLTLVGLVAVMNIVNFSDGVDGLAAGLVAITAVAFSIIAFDLGDRHGSGVLAAVLAGAALGFLLHNFPPASVFMGDSGANLLGLLVGCVAVEGTLKTQAVVALILPLLLLAVPFLDTTFVVLKRLKYHRPVYEADAEHFHHRFSRIGFSQRRTILYLYAWALLLAGLALAVRFVPYSDNHGHFHAGWSLVLAAIFVVVAAASVYLVYVLEILKFKRLFRRTRPEATDREIEEQMETGEFDAVGPLDGGLRD